MSVLLAQAQIGFDCEIVISYVNSIKKCIEEMGTFMTEEEIENLSRSIFQLLVSSDTRKVENSALLLDSQIEDDERDCIQEDCREEEDLQVALAELIGTLFKTHKAQTIKLADLLCDKIIP